MTLRSRYDLGPRRSGVPASAALAEMRANVAASPSPHAVVDGATIAEQILGGVRCLVVNPATQTRGSMLYFHGGGYRLGGPDRMTGFLSRLAADSDCRVIAPAYALAPDEPYPAALHDAAAVIAEVVASAPDTPLVIGGDSAGGGLAAACCVTFGEALTNLTGTVLLSPWLDLRVCADTFETCAQTDLLFSRQAATEAAAAYLQGLPADTPLASPLLADSLAGVPSALIIAGSAEVLLRDSLDFAARLAAQHSGVELIVVPRMQHVSPAIFPELASSQYAIEAIGRFVRARLDGVGLTADPEPAT